MRAQKDIAVQAPEQMVAGLLDLVRRDLYRGKPEKAWFSQQQLVKKALLYPATWLNQREVEIPVARYQAIVEGIVATMVRNGRLEDVSFMSRYLLTCVQRHMEVHGDEYYREGVAIRNRVSLVMDLVEKALRGEDGSVPVLAQADKLLRIGKRKAGGTRRAQATTTVETPRKVRSDALVYKLTPDQRTDLRRQVDQGMSYRKALELCASWGVKTSLGAIAEHLKVR